MLKDTDKCPLQGQIQERKAALIGLISNEVFGEAEAAEVARIDGLNKGFKENYKKDVERCLKR